MRILIVTALFPPDVAAPAPYVKELTSRLSAHHSVTVLTYGFITESVAVTVAKDQPAYRRLSQLYRALWSLAHDADVVLVNNAPSTELPAWAATWYVNSRWLLITSDPKIVYRGWRGWLHRLACTRLQKTALVPPPPRPEHHPFDPPSEAAWQRYEASWQQHVSELQTTIV
jgi:hypothetical protein